MIPACHVSQTKVYERIECLYGKSFTDNVKLVIEEEIYLLYFHDVVWAMKPWLENENIYAKQGCELSSTIFFVYFSTEHQIKS